MVTEKTMTVAQVLDALRALHDQMPKTSRNATPPSRVRGDVRDGSVYLMDDKLQLAVQVAVATGRPLLLTGDPGTGKSSLAAFLAARLGWRYYEHVVTGRTEANDLLWGFDTVRKLGDASGHSGRSDTDYVEPGVLWWAFDREGARARGIGHQRAATAAGSAQAVEPAAELNAGRSPRHAVVLIDEIDKADPDVPNALLVPLGSGEFTVRETQTAVKAATPDETPRRSRRREQEAPGVLVIITSNGERELPPAFLRRCVVHELAPPDATRLERIAAAHATREGRKTTKAEQRQVGELAQKAVEIRTEMAALGRKGAGTAEFLDAVRASRELAITQDSDFWFELISLTLRKGAARP